MPRFAKYSSLARVAPWVNVGLLLLAVFVTALLAWRAHQAASAHRSTAEQTLREYAAFAAFQLRNTTLNVVVSRFRGAMSPVRQWSAMHPDSALTPEEQAALMQTQASACRCLGGARFYYHVDFADSTISATEAPLATREALRWFRDTVITHGLAISRDEQRNAAPAEVGGTSAAYVPIPARIDGQRVIFVSELTFDVFGRPSTVYGFATDPEHYVADAIRRTSGSQRILPAALTRGIPIDSILALRVLDSDGELVYRNAAPFDTRFAAVDSFETRHGGLQFHVAINPAMADRLIIGGMPRSRLPSLIGLFALSAGLLVLLLLHLGRQQELMRLRSEFVSGVSHELRTPLAQIRVLAELLRLGKIPSEDRRERALRIIDQEARRLSFLVESILRFSTRDHDRVEPTITDVAAEVDETVTGFEPLASMHGVRLETSLQRGLMASVDRAAMRQVLLNLLDNAVRYGPEGQTVQVRTESHNGTWRLTVEDQGKGIPVEERERVFEPYYRMRRDARGEKGGSGIGLAVVRDLVGKHGGRVTVADAATGQGTRFSLELPIAGPAPEGGR